jgi:hypothetical protein
MASHSDREISSATAANLSFKHAEYETLRQEILTRNEFRQRTVELDTPLVRGDSRRRAQHRGSRAAAVALPGCGLFPGRELGPQRRRRAPRRQSYPGAVRGALG